MYNNAIMLGRITNDLELKTTPNGVSVLSFSIAVDRRYQEKGKDRVSDFFNCVAWRQEAEFISRFFHKGSAILLAGELQNRKYTDKNGVERTAMEIIVERATFTGEKSDKSGNAEEKPTEPTTEQIAPAGQDDDYPF
jgi:single-strand DNA-binding protein